jgi:hypothetical protein
MYKKIEGIKQQTRRGKKRLTEKKNIKKPK